MTTAGLIFVAGIVTVLNPCVLPLLPIVLASSLREGRFAPLALIGGLVVSFAVLGTAVTALSFAIGFNPDVLRVMAGGILLAAGTLMVSAPLMAGFVRVSTPLVSGAATLSARLPSTGPVGQAGLGALLGVVWSPCTGPTLGAAIGLAAQGETIVQSGLLMLVFGLGVAVPLLALAYGSRQALAARRDGLRRAAQWAKPAMGWALLLIGFGLVSGLDRRLEARILDFTPQWLIQFTTAF
ncbi:MAG: cytochrome c biogenesis CcdA family protein [Proteobacteria bacterium]|nr:cytochrome c biogenesis CcdA family protein [Pseudomonadota bacterium]